MDRIQLRRDSLAQWAKVNPVLLEGEVGLVLDDPNKYKVGDGINAWNDLPLRGFNGTVANAVGDSEDTVISQKFATTLASTFNVSMSLPEREHKYYSSVWRRISRDASAGEYSAPATYQIGDKCNMPDDETYSYEALEVVTGVPPYTKATDNKYNLSEAITALPASLRRLGMHICFINYDNEYEIWESVNTSFTSTSGWQQTDGKHFNKKFSELETYSSEVTGELYGKTVLPESSQVGKYYNWDGDYTTDSYNGFTVDFYKVNVGDMLTINGNKSGYVMAIALLSSKEAIKADYIYEKSEELQERFFSRNITIPAGISYIGISRSTDSPYNISVLVNNNDNKKSYSVLVDTVFPYAETKSNVRYIKELYFPDIIISEESVYSLWINVSTETRQCTLYKDNEVISDYYTSTDLSNGVQLVELKPFGDNRIKGYAIIDWSAGASSRINLITETICNINNSPKIASYINRLNMNTNTADIETLNMQLYNKAAMASETSVVGKYYNKNKQYTTDSYNGFTVDFYKVEAGDDLYIKGYKIGNPVAAIALLPNIEAELATEVYDISTSISDKMPFERYLKIKDDITYVAISRATTEPNQIVVYKKGAENRLDSIEELKLNNKWKGKRLLAIGDSVTAAKGWQTRVGELLGMEVRTHAKGGIGIITMVDGDGSETPPDYDPDGFGQANLYPLNTEDVKDVDIIIIMGFYNARTMAVSNPGNDTDMYPAQNTFIGQVNYAIKRIYEELANANNLNCKVVICSAHKYGKYAWSDITAYDDGENILECTRKAANYNSLYLIDLMNNAGINRYTWNIFQNSNTPYNPDYIPSDGINNGTDKPFASLEDAPDASSNNGKYITVFSLGTYKSNGTIWEKQSNYPYPWNGDQLHPGTDGYNRIGEYVAGCMLLL